MLNDLVCFVILHYQTLEETIKCIDSISQLKERHRVRVVIIDNASPNESGKSLENLYKNNEYIHVLINDANLGFSKANNIACNYAKHKWNPKYYVVANNDIIFTQSDFISKLDMAYAKYGFDVLGPDIFDITHNVHQNPMGAEIPSKSRVRITIAVNTLLLAIYPLGFHILKWQRRHNNIAVDSVGFDRNQENVWLMGACIIFSSDYFEESTDEIKAFYPETFFYYEEAILGYYCMKNSKNLVYCPNLEVSHINGTAIKANKNEYNQIRFITENILKSAKIYNKYINE